jgi:GH24 family phage-related lysozyme (muramidase)
MPSLSPTCITLVKNFEGFRSQPVRLPDGRFLIGYNHVQVTPPCAAIEEREAEQMLKSDLEGVAAVVRSSVHVVLTQCQFDALVCFAFSIGLPEFERSDVLRHVNAGEQIAAACAMEAWRKSTANGESVVLDALVRRRAVEKSLFLYEGIRAPAASALVCPEVDPVAAVLTTPFRTMTKQDDVATKLRTILAQEPQTMNALNPPPESEDEKSDEAFEVAGVKAPRDLVGYSALGALGALLITMGMTGAPSDNGVAHILFTAPGVMAVIMSVYYLLKRAAE